MSELIQLSDFIGPQAPWALSRKEVLPAEPARVWKALTMAEELTRWWCNAAEVDPREGGRYLFEGPTVFGNSAGASIIPGNFEILEWVAGERLKYSWWVAGVETQVTYELSNQ